MTADYYDYYYCEKREGKERDMVMYMIMDMDMDVDCNGYGNECRL